MRTERYASVVGLKPEAAVDASRGSLPPGLTAATVL
jgi:hypothetical protein